MITTDKNIERYTYKCDCGNVIEFASNQPKGDNVPLICRCFRLYSLIIPDNEGGKHKYCMRESTRQLRQGIINIFNDIGRRMTVRQVFYQAVSKGIVPKEEAKGYNLIQRNLLEMRRCGHLPYYFISDISRRRMKPDTYLGLNDALENWMQFYRQDVWANQRDYVEIWLEKDALGGIFHEVTHKYDVPLYIARGFSSESFLFEAAENIKEIGKPTHIYFFSDYDPSGIALCKQVERMLPRFGADIIFKRAALSPAQIEHFALPTRPTKKNTHSRGFRGESVELDALHPDILHSLIEDCIHNHITEADFKNIEMEEAVQKATLAKMKNNFMQA